MKKRLGSPGLARGVLLCHTVGMMPDVFLVGAGASAAPPASLALFAPLREYLLDRLRVSGPARDTARELAPEAFMRAVFEGGMPLEEWLGLAYASAHVLVADFLAGRLSSFDALDRIASLGVGLTTRTGGEAVGPTDFCLGARPDDHELFLP